MTSAPSGTCSRPPATRSRWANSGSHGGGEPRLAAGAARSPYDLAMATTAGTPLPLVSEPAQPPSHDAAWYRDARRARQLSWVSLLWMSIEGVVGLLAGFEAGSL